MTAAAILQHATTAQQQALYPHEQVGIRASAGSGKTTVLTRRVLSLLLHGVEPGQILCLTYTRVAAAEMKRRVSAALSEWLTLPDAALYDRLAEQFPFVVTPAMLSAARYAALSILDAPDTLRFTTLHGFCQQVLMQFPVEAGLNPGFTLLEGSEQAALLSLAIRTAYALAERDNTLSAAVGHLAGMYAESYCRGLVFSLLNRRQEWAACRETHPTPQHYREALAVRLGLSGQTPPEGLRVGAAVPALQRLADALQEHGGKTAASKLPAFRAWLAGHGSDEEYAGVFLTTENTPLQKVVTKAVKDKDSLAEGIFQTEAERIQRWQRRTALWNALEDSSALYTLALTSDTHYQLLKQAENAVDFDDLLRAAAALLEDTEAGPWIRYRLDQRISHVLVDEAQDTSALQWRIVSALLEEYYHGDSRDTPASLFVVGDYKQSIYGFQGAAPEVYRDEQERLARHARSAQRPWREVELAVSFRSSRAVLDVVDAVFADGVLLGDTPPPHQAARQHVGGVVACWPAVPTERQTVDYWRQLPVEHYQKTAGTTVLAFDIAARIAQWCSDGTAAPGDILILLRKRGTLMTALEQALAHRGIPCAGRDRLELLDELAIQDLLAFGRFLLLPEDDLNTAALLKSPLGGVDEEGLFALCHGRRGSVWQAVKHSADPVCQEVARRWGAILALSDYWTPLKLYSHLLYAHGGKAQLLGRLGARAALAIDQFEGALVTFEQHNPPFLGLFLDWFARGASSIKRESEAAAGRAVRLMTVHGAKGLEAPVVILAEESTGTSKDRVYYDEDAKIFLLNASTTDYGADIIGGTTLKEEAEKARLLYVALTRAADRLYLAATDKVKEGWYSTVRTVLESLGAKERDDGTLYYAPQKITPLEQHRLPDQSQTLPLPGWVAYGPAPERHTPLESVTHPDEEEGTTKSTADFAAEAAAYGSLVHRLLHQLALYTPAERADAVSILADAWGHGVPEPQRQNAARHVLALLENPSRAAVFADNSTGEVPIVGWRGKRLVRGRMDRVVRSGDTLSIIDFKTGALPGVIPPAWQKQLAAYEELVRSASDEHTLVSSALVGVGAVSV